ncbi:MAG TPA: hypothetical protein VJQ44_14045 [Gemmatimonadales bacterium]|nr:hypothetical protein [Gemmatimonadales bacterium]
MHATARATLLLAVAVFASSCDDLDQPTSPDETTPADAPAPELAVSYSGIPFGPYGLYANTTEFEWGPKPFTTSLDNAGYPKAIVNRINAARQDRHRLILAMAADRALYITNGKFDLAKWKSRMNTLNTATIRDAVAKGVADGTIVGNKLIDEPEIPQWGGVLSKSMIDQMATYAKKMFPTLPMGITHGAGGFKWHSGERYRVLDWVGVQYSHNYNGGNITSWRSEVLNFAQANHVTPVFALNILNGGVRDRNGSWDCPSSGGRGTIATYCRMTADQVRSWGRAVGTYGCALLMWRYDDAFMSKSANATAFKDVASLLNSKPRRSCRRP